MPSNQAEQSSGDASAPDIRAIDAVLASVGRERAGEPAPVADSVRNDNYRVETVAGAVFVRLHRHSRSRERIELNLAAMEHAGRGGIPIAPPLADPNGRRLFSLEGRLVSVYPWVEHLPLARGAIGPGEARVLGEMHGRLHSALATFGDPRLEIRGILRWDTEAVITTLSRIDDVIRYYPAPPETSLAVQRDLREQLALLEGGAALPCWTFDGLAGQPVHGDYHERNVLLNRLGAVAAVIDWDMVGLAPPTLEVVHSLDFMGLLEPALIESYVGGYREHATLELASIAPAVDLWWQVNLHDTWAYRTYFIEGDARPARFFPEIGPRLRRLADPGFRAWLRGALQQFGA